MSSIIKQVDNGVDTLEIGYTGISGYLKDGHMTTPLFIGETGQSGVTGYAGKSLIGILNELASRGSYSNPEGTPDPIGGIKAGTSFSNKTMEEMWDSLLYPYQEPAFSSFTFGWSTPLEIGASTPVNPTAIWATTNGDNINTDSVDIDDITGATNLVTDTANDGTEALTLAAITKTSATYNQFRIKATNSESAEFSRTYNIYWQWRRYYGESASTPLNEADIEGLRVGGLSSGFAGTYSFVGGGYKYLCYADSLGTATSFVDTSTQLPVPMESVYTVSITNSLGQSTDYNVHRTTNILGSAISIAVS